MKAIWRDTILAESPETHFFEEHHYFPPESLNSDFFELSDTHSSSPGKGKASYFHIQVGDHRLPDAAWFYPHPEESLQAFKNCVAFSNEVEVKN